MWNTLKVGIKNLMLHKLRSLLTALGVILGVGSVIAMLAVGEGSKKEALERIRSLGANNVIIRSVKPNLDESNERKPTNEGSQSANRPRVVKFGLEHEDLDRLRSNLPTIERAVPVALIKTDASRQQNLIRNARVLGTTPEFLEIKNLEMGRGSFVTAAHIHSAWNVAILGEGAARKLFQFVDPLEKTIFVGGDVYRVIGVLASQDSGNNTPGAVGQSDLNDDIYVPITCVQRRLGEIREIPAGGGLNFEHSELSEITLTVTEERFVSQTAEMARQLLIRTHPDANDFSIQVPLELLQQANEEKRMWNIVLGSIASISLLVGGIGIMNIMLASVTERTREIGIRRALGATKRAISVQFLVETILLSSVGGVIGVIVGITIPTIVSYLTDLETVISWYSVVLSFGISVGIGIVFGWYPAQRAASLDPIEALRHE
jgi:putative ABC transport system permease protein